MPYSLTDSITRHCAHRYVYGFDEMPEADNVSVYEIFGAIKKRWPEVTTMAVLDWETFPADLPLDIWVDEYVLPYPCGGRVRWGSI
jgi:hypothetical protein